MKIQLQERDKNLLHNLHRYGVLSTRQVAKRLFQNTASSTMLRRLRLLQDAGFIKNCGHLPDGAKVWSISKLGSQKINKEPPIRYSNQNTHQHDVYLSEVRMCLENIGLGDDWTTDAELKRNLVSYKITSIIPDGLFIGHFFGKDQVIALKLRGLQLSTLRLSTRCRSGYN